MNRDVLTSELQDSLLRGDHTGIEVVQLNWLMRTAPREYVDREELQAQIRYYALEAIEIYDPNRGMKFSTFLVQHLRLRCQAFQQYMWVRSSGNKNCRKLPLTQLAPTAGQAKVTNSDEHTGDDAGPGRDQSSVLAVPSTAEALCAIRELLDSLTPACRDFLTKAFTFDDQDGLASAFSSKHFRDKVSKLVGLTKSQVEAFVSEIRTQGPAFI